MTTQEMANDLKSPAAHSTSTSNQYYYLASSKGSQLASYISNSATDRNQVISQRSIGIEHVPNCKEKTRQVLNGPVGISLDFFNTFFSIVSCIMYLLEVYETDGFSQSDFNMIELGMSIYFAVDFAVHIYVDQDPIKYMMSPMGIIDIITIVPAFVMIATDSTSSPSSLTRVFRVFRALRILRLYRLVGPNSQFNESKRAFNFELGVFLFSIGAIIFVAAGIFQALEEDFYKNEGIPFKFHDGLYFVLVTISTVGYGDITPKSELSKFFVMVLIVSVLTLVPRQINRLFDLARTNNSYDGEYPSAFRSRVSFLGQTKACCHISNPNRSLVSKHIILCGNSITLDALVHFLAEFYHASRGQINRHTVILTNRKPTAAIMELVNQLGYCGKVFVFKGSILKPVDQERVKLREADAVFVLGNRRSICAQKDDTLTILQALAVKNYSTRLNLETNIFMQMTSPMGKFQLGSVVGVNQEVNSVDLENAILARGAVCPGACSLILNLMRSHEFKYEVHLPSWMEEYGSGVNHEIYTIHLSQSFDGYTFKEAARSIFEAYNVILLGKYEKNRKGNYHVVLWPMESLLQNNDQCFIIASSASMVHLINRDFGQHDDHAIVRLKINGIKDHKKFRKQPAMEGNVEKSTEVILNEENITSLDSTTSSPPQAPKVDGTKNRAYLRRPSTRIDDDKARYEACLIDSVHDITYMENFTSQSSTAKLNRHILVCGPPIPNFISVIESLRAFYREDHQIDPPIVILSNSVPSYKDWKRFFGSMVNIYFLEGSPVNCDDLIQAGALAALKIVILSLNDIKNSITTLLSSDGYLDEDNPTAENSPDDELDCEDYGVIAALMSVEAIKRRRSHHSTVPSGKIGCDSLYSLDSSPFDYYSVTTCDSSTYLDSSRNIMTNTYSNNSSSINDQALCPIAVINRTANIAFCRPQNDLIVDKTIGTDDFAFFLNPSYAAGRILAKSQLDLLVCQAYFNPYVTEIIHLLTGKRRFHHKRENSRAKQKTQNEQHLQKNRLLQIPVPVELIGKPYLELFNHLIEKNFLAIGLYRYDTKVILRNPLPFTYTCPKHSVKVNKNDAVFVIGCQ